MISFKEEKFRLYSERHVHFLDIEIPQFILKAISLKEDQGFNIVDLGCGDGSILYALKSRGLLRNAKMIVGVDLSEERIQRVSKIMPEVMLLVGDACDIRKLNGNMFDVVICSQVIEHVRDDKKLLSEIKRILRVDGIVYISSIVKRRYGIYIYMKNGSFRLDPTHLREYPSRRKFLELMESCMFTVLEDDERSCSFPIIDLLIRSSIMLGFIKPKIDFFFKHQTLRNLRKLKFPILGYRSIEALISPMSR